MNKPLITKYEANQARYDGTDDFRIGIPRDGCTYPTGPLKDAWLEAWDKCATDLEYRKFVVCEPTNRQTIVPSPERPNRSGPND